MGNEKEKRTNASYLLMESSRLHKLFSPPLWYPFFACQPTDRGSLIRHPINRDVCVRFSLIETWCHDTSGESIVIGVLNPWHCCIVYKRLVTGVNVIDSDLNFNGFVRIEHVRLQMDHFTGEYPGVGMWGMCWRPRWHGKTGKKKKKREREKAPYCFLSLFAWLRCHWISTLIS